MSLQVNKESGSVYDPVFLKILEDIPGGVTIKTNRFPTDTKEIKKGALLNDDATTAGLYNVIKTVRVTAAAAAADTVLAVEPADHLFKANDYIYTNLIHANKIVTAEPATLHLAVALATGGVASGAVLYETATVTTATALYAANAVLRDTIEVRDEKGEKLANIFAGAVVRGTVDESEMPYFVTAADKTALTARIRFA